MYYAFSFYTKEYNATKHMQAWNIMKAVCIPTNASGEVRAATDT